MVFTAPSQHTQLAHHIHTRSGYDRCEHIQTTTLQFLQFALLALLLRASTTQVLIGQGVKERATAVVLSEDFDASSGICMPSQPWAAVVLGNLISHPWGDRCARRSANIFLCLVGSRGGDWTLCLVATLDTSVQQLGSNPRLPSITNCLLMGTSRISCTLFYIALQHPVLSLVWS